MYAALTNRNNHSQKPRQIQTQSLSWAFCQSDAAKMFAMLKADIFFWASMDDVSINRNNHICDAPHEEAKTSTKTITVLNKNPQMF
jgi:hypothetical protein